MRIVWWTVRRITYEILGVNGLSKKCFLPYLRFLLKWLFFSFNKLLEESFLGEGVGVREEGEGGRESRDFATLVFHKISSWRLTAVF